MEDSESRIQAHEYSDQAADGSLSPLYGYVGLSGSNNRLRESSATSYYLEDTMDFGKLALTVGLDQKNTINVIEDGVKEQDQTLLQLELLALEILSLKMIIILQALVLHMI
jgi:hypothetical protein